jgi:replication factor C small subunit
MVLEIWTEKYRPQTLSEVKGQEDVTSRLKAFVSSKNMPHLLFAGPAGVGKTASAIALARDLFGDNWRDSVLELNASDERGIDIVRTKIKDFARSKAIVEVPFKVIYLDEADALTKEAQHALRRTMEDYAQSTRFILSCNYSSKIISPIQSRCAVFRYKPLPREILIKLLTKIAEREGLQVNIGALNFLYEASQGDCRKAENLLQACSAITTEIDLAAVQQVVSFAEPKEIATVIDLAVSGKFIDAKNKLFDIMIKHGLSGMDVISQIQKQVANADFIEDKSKVELIRACGDYEFRLVEGANEFIQLEAMLAHFTKVDGKIRKILPDLHILPRRKDKEEEGDN